MFTKNRAQHYLNNIVHWLKRKKRVKVLLSPKWVKSFSNKPGVYVAFEGNKIVYVGETGNIQGRMRDLLDTRHHNLRRNIGRANFSTTRNFCDANSKQKFPKAIEQEVEKWFKEKIRITCLETKLGRKEIEEKLIEIYKPVYNRRKRRKSS